VRLRRPAVPQKDRVNVPTPEQRINDIAALSIELDLQYCVLQFGGLASFNPVATTKRSRTVDNNSEHTVSMPLHAGETKRSASVRDFHRSAGSLAPYRARTAGSPASRAGCDPI
jgi:hypothetical protein